MFKGCYLKLTQSVKEGREMKRFFVFILFLALVFCASGAFASSSQTVTVSATVPTTAGLSVTINKVVGSTWNAASSIAFGTLAWDSTNQLFKPADDSYYVLDVDVTDNSGTTWTLTHTRQSLASGTNKLDDNLNVTFYKQTSSSSGTQLSKVSFDDSDNVAYSKTSLSGGWLRIYYGIATGSGDASGVTTLGASTVAGTYTGSVTITLTP